MPQHLFVFPPVETVGADIVGSEMKFPVHRLYCVGRNYAAHTKEMGGNPDREAPFFFTKPADSLVENHSVLDFPRQTKDLHHEIELVVALERGGTDILPKNAEDHIYGYAVGVDLTRRDMQQVAKDARRPWDLSKGFDQSAPMSAIKPRSQVSDLQDNRIWLSVNGEIRQEGTIAEMIWSIPEMISILSQSITLKPGDLIFTGTPAGVGPLKPGDRVTGGVDYVGQIDFSYHDRRR